jgi:hypothetical protein
MTNLLARLACAPLLLLLGCAISGIYGALHDQISYTASPDYFHAFKFHQFRIPPDQHNRLGAAIVGWKATWWMGVVIGVPLLTAGLLLTRTWREFVSRSLIAFGVVATTALVIGLAALAGAAATISETRLPGFWFPDEPIDKVAFARVGVMHNFSYLGGFLGILTGVIYLAIARFRSGSTNTGTT